MAPALDEFIDEYGAIAERGLRFAATSGIGVRHVVHVRDRAHAPPAAAGGCLQHHRETDLARRERGGARRIERSRTWNDRYSQRIRKGARSDLVAKQRKRRGRWTDEHETARR